MDEKKKVWETPQLVVLGRGRPEESVLGICKTKLTPGPASGSTGTCGTHACTGIGQS